VAGSPKAFRLELRAPRGFVRPPRWLRIEPNVLPVTERGSVEHESHAATGQSDFSFDLEVPGLCFGPDTEPPRVEIRTDGEFQEWTRCDRLAAQGPADRVYELDPVRGRLLFGNGLNGRKPATGAEISVSYGVSSGPDGNVARNRRLTVAGFTGVFGINPDPVTGGAAATDWVDLRREARRHAKSDHALVTAADLESAALALPLVEVARAWVLAPRTTGPQTGTLTLIAMRRRPDGVEPAEPPETARWLAAVRRRVVGRMPLGTRLVVAGPRYADFAVRVEVVVEAGRDPAVVAKAVTARLKEKLALTPSPSTPQPRAPGVPVTRNDVAAWVLGVEGVERVATLELVQGRNVVGEIAVPRGGLPRLQLDGSTIDAGRSGARSTT
jgi:predicted phage baseplate assembly protein